MENGISSPIKVRFSDCDPIGHLNNVKYLEYMLNAREDYVESYFGFNYEEYIKKTGCTWITVQNEIAYLKEVRANNYVKISNKTIAVSDRMVTVELIMSSEDGSVIHSVLWITVIYFNMKTRKSEIQPLEVQKLFHKDFEDLGIWSEKLSNDLVLNDGSVQNINLYNYIEYPSDEQIIKFEKIRTVYKTIWETSQKKRTDVAVVKQPFNDQAMSMNVFYNEPNISQWSSALVYAWKNKLKTGNYYCRIKKGTANKNLAGNTKEKPKNSLFDCEGCSS